MKQFRNSIYHITEDGRVWNSKRNKFMKLTSHQRYSQVGMNLEHKIRKTYTVHRLVAECYVSNPNNYPQVNHIDGNRYNNHYVNLEWCTASQNVQHSHNIGVSKVRKGSKCNFAKINENDIPEIKRLYFEEKMSQPSIAKIYGIRQPQVSRIINNIRWQHLKDSNGGQ